MRQSSALPIGWIFFLSGFASLVYQVAWQRGLTLYLGVGALSTTLIVSVFILGLGLGGLAGARLTGRLGRGPGGRADVPGGGSRFAWERVYALVQAAVGSVGLCSPWVIDRIGAATASAPPALAFASLFAFLLVPTFLMGLALPILVTVASRENHDYLFCVSRLYFANTIGACLGCFATGFVLVSLAGLRGCVYLAALIDLAVAAALLAATSAASQPTADAEAARRPDDDIDPRQAVSSLPGWTAYALALVAGFLAIGYEIVWFRLIGVLVKDSPYAFASVLGVYLFGIAAGSAAIHAWLERRPRASRLDVFLGLEFLIGFVSLASIALYYYLAAVPPVRDLTRLSFTADLHPSPALFETAAGATTLANVFLLVDIVFWPAVFLLVPAVLIGACFPLVTWLARARRGDEGSALGTTYFFTVAGNVIGGLATGLVLLPSAGTERTLLLLGWLGLAFGLFVRAGGTRRFGAVPRVAAVAALAVAFGAAFPGRGQLWSAMHVPPFEPFALSVREGRDAVVLTYENGGNLRNFVGGQGHGYRPGPFFYAEALEGLGHAPALGHVLVVGLGAGSFVEAALADPRVGRVTVVELCPSVVANLRRSAALAPLFGDPRLSVEIDDARRFLMRTDARFDVILMDPLRTTTAYSNNVHSRQFFALARGRLAPAGVLLVGGLADPAVIARTLLSEFDAVRAYPGFCLASAEPLRPRTDGVERLPTTAPPGTRELLDDARHSAIEGQRLRELTARVPVNDDWWPASEYYLTLPIRSR